jgi:hypothetical protein
MGRTAFGAAWEILLRKRKTLSQSTNSAFFRLWRGKLTGI